MPGPPGRAAAARRKHAQEHARILKNRKTKKANRSAVYPEGGGPPSAVVSGPPGTSGKTAAQVVDENKRSIWKLSVLDRQRRLKARGYNIPVDGQSGPLTASAGWAYVHGIPADTYNRAGSAQRARWAGLVASKSASWAKHDKGKPSTHPAVTAAGKNKPQNQPKNNPNAAADGNPFNLPQLDFDPETGQLIPESLLKGVYRSIGLGYADDLAQKEFGQALREAAHAQDLTRRQNAQNLKDVGGWYGTVLGSQATAAQRDAEINRAALQSVGNANAAILGSLGGASNEGAPVMAAEGADQAGLIGALGSAQDQYNSDLAPLLQAERAGALTREQAAGTNRMQELANQLLDLHKQQGESAAAHEFEIRQYNQGVRQAELEAMLGIRGANNTTRQQTFQNRLAMDQEALARAGLIPDYINAQASATRAAKTGQPKPPNAASMDKISGGIVDMIGFRNKSGVWQWRQSPNVMWAKVLGRVEATVGVNTPEGRRMIRGIAAATGIRYNPKTMKLVGRRPGPNEGPNRNKKKED